MLNLTDEVGWSGQQYRITHPQACVNGILKGSYYGTISDQISVTCSGGSSVPTKLRAILDYKDEVRKFNHTIDIRVLNLS
jgi:hypothetical protein